MKGHIFLNPFLIPKESVYQAERLTAEFTARNVSVDVVSDGYIRSGIFSGESNSAYTDADFGVYLDKDKYFSEILEKGGLRLFNTHSAIRLCDDKAATCLALSGKGISMPDTVFGALCYRDDMNIDLSAADKLIKRLNLPMIVKECYGSSGNGVYLAETKEQLVGIMNKVKLKPHLFQKYLPARRGVDVRVIVIGGRAAAAMERRNENDFRSNVAKGGTGRAIKLSPEFTRAAESAAKILGLDYCGVDILYGDDLRPYICEVNSNAYFNGIESATGINVAALYAEHIINTMKNE